MTRTPTKFEQMKADCRNARSMFIALNPTYITDDLGYAILPLTPGAPIHIDSDEIAARLVNIAKKAIPAAMSIAAYLKDQELEWTCSKLEKSANLLDKQLVSKANCMADVDVFPRLKVKPKDLVEEGKHAVQFSIRIYNATRATDWIANKYKHNDVIDRVNTLPLRAEALIELMNILLEIVEVPLK